MLQKSSIFTQTILQVLKQVTISNSFITLIVLDYGAIIQKLLVKDKDGNTLNMVVGHNFPSLYLKDQFYLGACVGRYAGRIANGSFELDRETHLLYQQDGVHLHGGKSGFGKKYWTFEAVGKGENPFVRLSYHSRHLEEGYPGNLKVTVTYRLENNSLHIDHRATTDRSTVVNLTNHSYFSLDNALAIDHYKLQLNCPKIAALDDRLLPTGELEEVTGTPYDFLKSRAIGKTRLDTPYLIDREKESAAKVTSPLSGITMSVETDQPAMVVYTPLHMPAICFETENLPDAPNIPHFPNSVLKPGAVYENKSRFIFELEK